MIESYYWRKREPNGKTREGGDGQTRSGYSRKLSKGCREGKERKWVLSR